VIRLLAAVATTLTLTLTANDCGQPPVPPPTDTVWRADVPAGTRFFVNKTDHIACGVTERTAVGVGIWTHEGPWAGISTNSRTRGLPGQNSPCRSKAKMWVRWSQLRNVRKP